MLLAGGLSRWLEPVVSVQMLDNLMARLDAEARDSNIDRLAATRDIDVPARRGTSGAEADHV